jgi:hypothetical protein
MSWIGKILSVFVLILGLATMWFITTVFVARANWKADRDAYALLYEQAKKARLDEQASYRTERDALERQLAAEQTKSKGLSEEVAKLTGSNEQVAKEITRLEKIIKESDVTAAELQALLQAMTDEVKKTRDRNVLLEKERQDNIVARENALKDRQNFENQAKQALSDKAVAEGKIEDLNTQIAELRAAGGRADAIVLNSFGKPPAPLPDGVRGTVTNYRDGYVELSIGIDAGLTQGAVLDIFRTDDGVKYLGTVVVERVYPKNAVATFKPADSRRTLAKLRAEELPKVGDTVGKVGISGPLGIKK